jgi:hypothetical protein
LWEQEPVNGSRLSQQSLLDLENDTQLSRFLADLEVPTPLACVGYREHSGRHVLGVSFSQSDPLTDMQRTALFDHLIGANRNDSEIVSPSAFAVLRLK